MSAAPGRVTIEDGIAWLVLDEAEKKVNTLSSRLMEWRFEPAGLLREMARRGATFHGGTM